jgi:nucleotide-binding universal stress UspA family protein
LNTVIFLATTGGLAMASHILIPTDGSQHSEKTIAAGVQFAKRHGATVTIYHALEPLPFFVQDESSIVDPGLLQRIDEEARKEGARLTAKAAQVAEKAGISVTVEMDRPLTADQGIIAAAKRRKCDLVFMGSHGRTGIANLLLGSVTQKVLSRINIPVTVYPDPGRK